MESLTKLLAAFRRQPPGQQALLAVSGALLVAALVWLGVWVSQPSYTVLFSDLDDNELSEVVAYLDDEGVRYRLEAGGSRVLVPQGQQYEARAALADLGVSGVSSPPGYDVLEDQGLTVTDFRQQVDYQRALEGELTRTLQAMEDIDSASVHLAMPDDDLFTAEQDPPSASVLLGGPTELNAGHATSVANLVAASVEGLEPGHVTVTTTDGVALTSPDAQSVGGAVSARQRETRQFEQQLANDIRTLLSASGSPHPANVVVRADLNFDEAESESETFGEEAIPAREQVIEERFEGVGGVPGGVLGVDGGPLPGWVVPGEDDGDVEVPGNEYSHDEEVREYAIDRTVERITSAPGDVERVSVAAVLDDGSATETDAPDPEQVEQLIAAAVGADEERGDVIEVALQPMAAVEAPDAAEEPWAWLPQAAAVAALLGAVVVAGVAALRLRRRKDDDTPELAVVREEPAPPAAPAEPEPDPAEQAHQQMRTQVKELAAQSPEEVADLLRTWLSDSRGGGAQ